MPIETQTITVTEVSEAHRLDFLPKYFGEHIMIKAESMVYALLREFSPDYTGALWNFYELSNGGFYMAPLLDKPLRISVQSNGFERAMSPDAAGVVVTLFALSHLTFELQNDPQGAAIEDHFYELREFAAEHAEAALILQAVD